MKSFTIIEIMIALALMAFLSVIILPQYNEIRREFSLLHAGFKLSQDIRGAREMAISAQPLGGGGVPGYGIYINIKDDNRQYLLYADLNGNGKYDSSAVDYIVDTINMPGGAYIKDLPGPTWLSINFEGPDPITSIFVPAQRDSAIIVLGLGSKEANVIVKGSGLIYTE